MQHNKQNSFRLESTEKKNIFSVPEGYFESLDKKIESRIVESNPNYALGKISDFSPLSPSPSEREQKGEAQKNTNEEFGLNASYKASIFKVPEGYFEQLPSAIHKKTNTESILDKPELKQSVFEAPQGYLNALEKRTKQRIWPEMESKELPFAIPDDYFETLRNKIEDRIEAKDNVIKFDFVASPMVRYAVAASAVLLVVASSLFFVFQNQTQTIATETNTNEQLADKLLASLDKNEVKLYLEKEATEVETLELMEFASEKKKEKIKSDLEQEIVLPNISDTEKQAIELEMNDMDIADLQSDI